MILLPRTYKWEFGPKTQKPERKTMYWLYLNYVLDCPVEKVSVRGRSFGDLGWKGSGFRTLESQMKKCSGLTNVRWCWLKDEDDEFLNKIRNANIFDSYSLEHEFAYYSRGSRQKIEGLFYLVRNSLAHGSFRYHNAKTGEYLAFEIRKNGKLRGRAVLKLETLKVWRSLINNSEKYLK